METFAFIVCPKTIKQLKSLLPAIRMVPDFILKPRLKKFSPFKVCHIKRIRSAKQKEIQGYFITCPLISQPHQELDTASILNKIISAADIAGQLGANILGSDINLSTVVEKGCAIDKKLKIPFTSGDTFTAWSIFEAVYRVARVENIDLKKSTVLVIGADSPTGSLCATKLSEYASKIILNVNTEHARAIEAIIEHDLDKAIKEADIVIDLEGIPALIFAAAEKLKSGAIVCTLNKAISRQDITIINGGLIKLPYPTKLGINLGLPQGIITASIAEAMLLTFADKFVSYSWGEQINPDKLEEIANIAVQHGFEVWVPEAPVI